MLHTIECSIVEPDVSAGFCMSPYSSDYIFIIRNPDDVWRVVSEDSEAYRSFLVRAQRKTRSSENISQASRSETQGHSPEFSS
jgi:hypothetical protein